MGDDTSVLQGQSASLSYLHQQDKTALSCALANLGDEVLLGPLRVERTTTPTAGSNDGGRIAGSLVITTSAVLFWDERKQDVETDVLIPGSCIDLHAILAENNEQELPTGVYLQLGSHDDEDDLMEMTIYPESAAKCEVIFRSVTKLIELHPTHAISTSEDEEEDDDAGGMIFMAGDADSTSATLQEREEMLERLDRLLVVPPEYEVVNDDDCGQFDDADDDIL